MQTTKIVREGNDLMVRPFLSGPEIERRMRAHGHTIRSVAARYQLTLKRVREVRAHGVTGALYVLEITS